MTTNHHLDSIQAEVQYVNSEGRPLIVIEPPEGEGDATRNFRNDNRVTTVYNARQLDTPASLDDQGFMLLPQTTRFQGFDSADLIRQNYYLETERLVKEITGARRVIAFDHNIRSDGDTDEVRKPAGIVHVDITEASARRIVTEQLSTREAKLALEKRFSLINTWRPLENPVFSAHLAFCDANTVVDSTLLKAELRYEDRNGELYYCAYHEDHRWYYYPRMLPEELLLLRNYDSGLPGNQFTPHTAITDPGVAHNAPARKSIEVRLLVLY